MDLLNALTLTAPNGFWHTIVLGLEGAIGDYALALILITVIIKLVMVPFDFINKYTSKKTARKQAEIKPELDKINKKYANDRNMLNQKTNELYKKNNVNLMGSCFGMLIYFVLTMVVFWSLFGSLNTISSYKIGDQFLQVRSEYYAVYGIDVNSEELDKKLKEEGKTVKEYLDEKIEALSDTEKAEYKTKADKKAVEIYNKTKSSFLWIDNIWIADTTTSPVMKYDNFIKQVKISEKELTQEEYDLIITPVKDVARDSNGYFILAILAATISYFSTVLNTWVSKYRAKKKGMDLSAQNQTNKILTFILPIIMGVFTLFYTAAFGLYIVAGSVISLITGPLITMFVDMLEFDAIKKANDRIMASYDRKRK